MAQGSIVHRFSLDISDTDRSVYEQLDMRVPRHPSETAQLFIARMLAWALNVQDGIESSGGICSGDEPALRVMAPDGTMRLWIEVGSPDAARLEKAARAAEAVRVYCHRDPRPLVQQLSSVRAARLDKIELFAMPLDVLDGLADLLERSNTWSVLHSNEELYVTVGAATFSGTLTRLTVAPPRA